MYDTQYWAHWSLPYGLLRVASWLRNMGYVLKLIDCLDAANEKRTVAKKMRKVRKLCSTEEYVPPQWSGFRPAEDEKIEYCFGLPRGRTAEAAEGHPSHGPGPPGNRSSTPSPSRSRTRSGSRRS